MRISEEEVEAGNNLISFPGENNSNTCNDGDFFYVLDEDVIETLDCEVLSYDFISVLPDNLDGILTGVLGEAGAAATLINGVWAGSLVNDGFNGFRGYWFKSAQDVEFSFNFSETDLNLNVQYHKDFLRVHYLEKKFHLLLLDKEVDCFKGLEMTKDLNAWEKDNILNKDFNIKPEDANKYTPHELGYHQTKRIDFEKGCYTGQEIVARMHYRAKKLPFLLAGSLDTDESTSLEVLNQEGKKAGTLLSTAKEENSNFCLISMNKNYENGEIKFKDSSAISIK